MWQAGTSPFVPGELNDAGVGNGKAVSEGLETLVSAHRTGRRHTLVMASVDTYARGEEVAACKIT
jgi:hypothetical protein